MSTVLWVPAFKEDVKVQRRTPKVPKGLAGMSSEEWLRTLGLSSLERRRLRGNLTALSSFLRGRSAEGGAALFSLGPRARVQGNGSKLRPSGEVQT